MALFLSLSPLLYSLLFFLPRARAHVAPVTGYHLEEKKLLDYSYILLFERARVRELKEIFFSPSC